MPFIVKVANHTQRLHVTPQMVDDFIAGQQYASMGNQTTVCVLLLRNGMEVVGTAVRQATTPNDVTIGQKFAYEDAWNKAYGLVISCLNGAHEILSNPETFSVTEVNAIEALPFYIRRKAEAYSALQPYDYVVTALDNPKHFASRADALAYLQKYKPEAYVEWEILQLAPHDLPADGEFGMIRLYCNVDPASSCPAVDEGACESADPVYDRYDHQPCGDNGSSGSDSGSSSGSAD